MPARTKDYYALLGVEKTASAEEIKKAFRHKARELHPDVNGAADAEDRFKEVNEAYDVLSDPDKRDQYDRFGRVGGPASAPGGYQYADFGDLFGGGGLNMEDLFSAFFGGVRGRGDSARGPRHGDAARHHARRSRDRRREGDRARPAGHAATCAAAAARPTAAA